MAERGPASLNSKVASNSRDLQDHAKTLTVLVERVGALEKSDQERAVLEARVSERSDARDKQLFRIETDIASIKGIGWKIFWIILAAVLGAFMTFALRGGGLMPV